MPPVLPRPVLLRPDNWTPPERTPWGGRAIIERWKAGLAIAPEKAAWPAIGESWELSFDRALPSRDSAGKALEDHVAALPEAWLGADPARAATARSLLVKLLDAREALSVQVHPADDDPELLPHESGKPEAWVVLAREPGAGIWLGLADGVGRDQLAAAVDASLADGVDRVRPLLNFVPVEVGDAFVIAAGTVHAIGPGVTLLEPQLVRPGLAGVTYRFWDWGRRFDSAGRSDPDGQPRPLHCERALAVTAWHAPRGAAFVASARRTVQSLDERRSHYLDLGGVRVERLGGDGPLTLPASGGMRVMMVLTGALTLGDQELRAGQTVAIPACHGPLELVTRALDAFLLAA